MAHKHLMTNLTPYALYTVRRGGSTLLQRVASSGGTILFDATNGATINVDRRDTYDIPSDFHTKYAALMAPVPGEVFTAPAELRLVAAGGDFNNLGATTADSIAWFDGDDALSVTGSDQYRTIFRARTAGQGG